MCVRLPTEKCNNKQNAQQTNVMEKRKKKTEKHVSLFEMNNVRPSEPDYLYQQMFPFPPLAVGSVLLVLTVRNKAIRYGFISFQKQKK